MAWATGGTLDKLDAIPGYQTSVDNDRFLKVVKAAGIQYIIGQTGDLAPRRQAYLCGRDITATVESIAMITGSISPRSSPPGGSAGDGRQGGLQVPLCRPSGHLKSWKSIVAVASGAGCRTSALLTDMNQVLASSAGNVRVEVRGAVRYLTGEYRSPRVSTK